MFKPMKKTIKIDVMDPHICGDQHFVSLTCVDDQGIKNFSYAAWVLKFACS